MPNIQLRVHSGPDDLVDEMILRGDLLPLCSTLASHRRAQLASFPKGLM